MARALLHELLGVTDKVSVFDLLAEYARQMRLAEQAEDHERMEALRWALACREGLLGLDPWMGQVNEGPAIMQRPQEAPRSMPTVLAVRCPDGHPHVLVAGTGEFAFECCEHCSREYIVAAQMEVVAMLAEKRGRCWELALSVEDASGHTHDLQGAVAVETVLPHLGDRVSILAFGEDAYALLFAGQLVTIGGADEAQQELLLELQDQPAPEDEDDEPRFLGLGRALVAAAMGLLAFLVWSFPLLQLSHEPGQLKPWSLLATLVCACMLTGGVLSLLTSGRRLRGAFSVLIAVMTCWAVLESGQGWPLSLGVSAWALAALLAVPGRRWLTRQRNDLRLLRRYYRLG